MHVHSNWSRADNSCGESCQVLYNAWLLRGCLSTCRFALMMNYQTGLLLQNWSYPMIKSIRHASTRWRRRKRQLNLMFYLIMKQRKWVVITSWCCTQSCQPLKILYFTGVTLTFIESSILLISASADSTEVHLCKKQQR